MQCCPAHRDGISGTFQSLSTWMHVSLASDLRLESVAQLYVDIHVVELDQLMADHDHYQ
jgi:hypothetical protein